MAVGEFEWKREQSRDGLGEALEAVRRHGGDQHRKTDAAEPRHRIGAHALQPARDLLEDEVALAMAKRGIDEPEPAQVDDDHADLLSLTDGALDHLDELGPAQGAGQHVVVADEPEPILGSPAVGDVAEREAHHQACRRRQPDLRIGHDVLDDPLLRAAHEDELALSAARFGKKLCERLGQHLFRRLAREVLPEHRLGKSAGRHDLAIGVDHDHAVEIVGDDAVEDHPDCVAFAGGIETLLTARDHLGDQRADDEGRHREMDRRRADQDALVELQQEGESLSCRRYREGRDDREDERHAAAEQHRHKTQEADDDRDRHRTERLQRASLLQRFGGERLEQRARQRTKARHDEIVAQFQGRGADHDLLASDPRAVDLTGEQVRRRNSVDSCWIDRIVDIEAAAFGTIDPRQQRRDRGDAVAPDIHRVGVGPHDTT